MKEAIGNAFVFNIVIVFLFIISALLVSSLSYTKAFKIKTMIVDVIEEKKGYDSEAKQEIENYLGEIGYRVNRNGVQTCKTNNGGEILTTSNNYRYCVTEHNTSKGKYYTVTAYMYFDVPLISDTLEFPIYGQTKIIYADLD